MRGFWVDFRMDGQPLYGRLEKGGQLFPFFLFLRSLNWPNMSIYWGEKEEVEWKGFVSVSFWILWIETRDPAFRIVHLLSM